MKIKNSFVLREIAGSNIVVPTGSAAVNFSGMITLNEAGAFLWSKISEGADEKQLVSSLVSEYNIEEATASADVAEFIRQMREADILE